MQAVFCERHGGPEVLVVREVPSPVPGHGQALVRVRAHGVSYVDVLQVAGKYQVQPPLPFVPGSEAAGEITALGDGVEGFAVGDRVLCSAGFAQEVVQNVSRLTRLPPSVDRKSVV